MNAPEKKETPKEEHCRRARVTINYFDAYGLPLTSDRLVTAIDLFFFLMVRDDGRETIPSIENIEDNRQ
jgi:hypothetical protein